MTRLLTKSGIQAARSHGTTKRQLAVLETVAEWIGSHGYPATVREIAEVMGIATNDVFQKLIRLRRDGVVDWQDGKCRTLRIVGGPF